MHISKITFAFCLASLVMFNGLSDEKTKEKVKTSSEKTTVAEQDVLKLHGKWISVNIDAESVLFDFIDTIELDVLKGMRFKGIATLIAGDTMSKEGSFKIVKDQFFAKVDGIQGVEKATFWFKDEFLFVKDKALSLTIKFKRKPKDSDSSGWFF